MHYAVLKDIVTFGFTLAGLIIAGKGLATWRKQIRGTKEFETAYNMNLSVLRLREAIKYVRNPGIWPSESQKAVGYAKTKYPKKSEEDLEKHSHPYVYEMRWEKISIAETEMESHMIAAEVLWNKDIIDLVKPLKAKITDLNIALQQNFSPADYRTMNAVELHKIIYDRSVGGTDEFNNEIEEIIFKIHMHLKDKLT